MWLTLWICRSILPSRQHIYPGPEGLNHEKPSYPASCSWGPGSQGVGMLLRHQTGYTRHNQVAGTPLMTLSKGWVALMNHKKNPRGLGSSWGYVLAGEVNFFASFFVGQRFVVLVFCSWKSLVDILHHLRIYVSQIHITWPCKGFPIARFSSRIKLVDLCSYILSYMVEQDGLRCSSWLVISRAKFCVTVCGCCWWLLWCSCPLS